MQELNEKYAEEVEDLRNKLYGNQEKDRYKALFPFFFFLGIFYVFVLFFEKSMDLLDPKRLSIFAIDM